MKYNYPKLRRVFSHYQKKHVVFDDVYLVCCQHILEPQKEMFRFFIDFGFAPSKIIVLGKIYSTNTEVLREIAEMGIQVIQPVFSGTSFDHEHRQNCETVFKQIPDDAKVIALDDGAELIRCASQRGNVLFAVEQTSSGFRKIENNPPSFPVINVARSASKLIQESPLIARLCYKRIEEYIHKKNVHNPSILVVGLGPIGEAVFEIFAQNKYAIFGFDVNRGDRDLLSVVLNERPDIIVGATGVNILSKEDVEMIGAEKKVYLVSVSSSDREFPVADFRIDTEIHNDVSYKNIIFINNGFPITFKGNRNELTPIEIEKTICLLSGSVLDGLVINLKKGGLVQVSSELEDVINQ